MHLTGEALDVVCLGKGRFGQLTLVWHHLWQVGIPSCLGEVRVIPGYLGCIHGTVSTYAVLYRRVVAEYLGLVRRGTA